MIASAYIFTSLEENSKFHSRFCHHHDELPYMNSLTCQPSPPGLSCLDTGSSGKMGSRALCYYFSTTILAAILGITMVTTIHPGDPSILVGGSRPSKEPAEEPQILDALLDIIR